MGAREQAVGRDGRSQGHGDGGCAPDGTSEPTVVKRLPNEAAKFRR